MNICTVIGARPQFVKAAPVSRALRSAGIGEWVIHTGQHYDDSMSAVFFRELEMEEPTVNLGVGSGGHGVMTGRMLEGIEAELIARSPVAVLVYGDTNSTLAGALAAAKLHHPVVHVEAGLRSFNRRMPEELNRILTDHLSSLLLCSSETSCANLKREGITGGVHLIGDVMADVCRWAMARVAREPKHLEATGIPFPAGSYFLMTLHRAENTDDPARIRAIVRGISRSGRSIVLALHPRTRAALEREGLRFSGNVHAIEPVGYLAMTALVLGSAGVVTDSGGLQKEAYWMRKRCVTLRDETEWVETVAAGWNRLVGADAELIEAALCEEWTEPEHPVLYGDGRAAERIPSLLRSLV